MVRPQGSDAGARAGQSARIGLPQRCAATLFSHAPCSAFSGDSRRPSPGPRRGAPQRRAGAQSTMASSHPQTLRTVQRDAQSKQDTDRSRRSEPMRSKSDPSGARRGDAPIRSIPFAPFSRRRLLIVRYGVTVDPDVLGFNVGPGAGRHPDTCRGYPIIHATIERYRGAGYRTLCGWIQTVTAVHHRARAAASICLDQLPAMIGIDMPFASADFLPDLFDAPCRSLKGYGRLRWTVDAFLTTFPLRSRRDASPGCAGAIRALQLKSVRPSRCPWWSPTGAPGTLSLRCSARVFHTGAVPPRHERPAAQPLGSPPAYGLASRLRCSSMRSASCGLAGL